MLCPPNPRMTALGPPHHALADWRVEQHPELLDNAVLATPGGVPINDVARGVLREHTMTGVRTERVPSLTDAESKRLGVLRGTTLAT